ncbi:hypothetical protein F4781DRAFT_437694 [Annulohypoxylon bovei var. microspora]|nr:hypothetical protein F4781DRAFT_437694 [Annulohypoxylon bovei var. microspora]
MAAISNEAEGLNLAFDGFKPIHVRMEDPINQALMTPLQGVTASDATVYNNALNLMSAAVLLKQEWKDNTIAAKMSFSNAVARHWGLATANSTFRFIEKLISARHRFTMANKEKSIFPSTPLDVVIKGRKQKRDEAEVIGACDILKSTKVPASVQDMYESAAPMVQPAAASENFARLVQEELVSRGFLDDKDRLQQIALILGKMLSPTGQYLAHVMIKEAQVVNHANPQVELVRSRTVYNIYNAITLACIAEETMAESITGLDVWGPRLFPTPREAEAHQQGVANDDEANVGSPAEQQNGSVDEEDNYDNVTLHVKREYDDGETSQAKRIRKNTDGEEDPIPTPPRHCIVM